MFEHDLKTENAYRFSRFDEEHPLSVAAPHPIELDGERWLSAEHYVWGNLLKATATKAHIVGLSTASDVYKYAKPWYRSKVKGWKISRRIYMTRALYTVVQMYPEVKAALLETGDQYIVETSLYDHYWGLGRDQRGENMMGVIWTDIRKKILDDQSAAS